MGNERKVGAMTRFVEVLATVGSFFLVLVTLPFSLCFAFKVVQEYERAVVFRMGRLKGGAYGPGKCCAIAFLFTPNRVVSITSSRKLPVTIGGEWQGKSIRDTQPRIFSNYAFHRASLFGGI